MMGRKSREKRERQWWVRDRVATLKKRDFFHMDFRAFMAIRSAVGLTESGVYLARDDYARAVALAVSCAKGKWP